MAGAERGETDICIIGAGPAGSTLAARLAQLGHDVCLVERASFPRSRLGESLSPGVLPLLETSGARAAVEAAGFSRVGSVMVQWGEGLQERRDPHEQGLLVERGRFDAILLDRARALGVRVLQPAMIRVRRWEREGWSLRVEMEGCAVDLRAAYLADASGQSSGRSASRRLTGCRTVALYAYWRGAALPEQPRIEAGTDAWYWGVPLPDGTYNTLVFVDLEHFQSTRTTSVDRRFRELLDRSGLLAGCRDARLASRVHSIDATPYLEREIVTPRGITVGDAALAIDPLSSSGVQKAIQSALAGAIVVNTLLRRPESGDAARAFYQDSLGRASERHCGWAASHYAKVAVHNDGKFWRDRAAAFQADAITPRPSALGPRPSPLAPIALSNALEVVDLPCLDDEFVTVKPAVRHPGLDGPVAYLGGWELAPLLRDVRAGATILQVARSWMPRVPLQSGLEIAGWLVSKGVLVPVDGLRREEYV